MSRDGNGAYNLPAGNPVVTGATIDSTVHNATMSDIAAALTQSLSKDGQTAATADQPMGGFKHTNVANAAARNQYATAEQVQDGDLIVIGSVSGTNTITGSMTPAITSYPAGVPFVFIPPATNTDVVTIALNGLLAKNIHRRGGYTLVPGDLVSGKPALIIYDGTQFILTNPAVDPQPILQNPQSGNYTLVLSDALKEILHPSGAGSGDTFTIPANASVAFPIGTVVMVTNLDSNSLSIAITSDTLTLAGTTTTGTRTLLQNSVAFLRKETSTGWLCWGVGLT